MIIGVPIHWAPFQEFTKMLRNYWGVVAAWTRIPATIDGVEGRNYKMKATSHRRFGYRTIRT